MKDIIWSKIKQGNYAIEEDGRVYSYYKNDYMKTSFDKDGYRTITLVTATGSRSHFGIHRLLMVTFKPCDDMDNLVVNHIDGNKLNNDLNNLEWVTNSRNVQLAHEDNLNNTVGENHGKAKLSEEQAKLIIKMTNQGYGTREIRKYIPFVTKNMVSSIKHNRTWKHLPR